MRSNRGKKVGEKLSLGGPALSSSKGTAVVTEVLIEVLAEPVKVYNFQVKDYHTYFAAPEADKPFVWVHNANYGSDDVLDVHRIGGGTVDNLKLKPAETKLMPPGISVLRSGTPDAAASQLRKAYKNATDLIEASKTVGSTNISLIRRAGFDMIPTPSKKLPNHYRIVHPDGPAGFSEENLARLARAFSNGLGG